MQKAKQNLTLVIEEELLREARKVAIDRRTSVNELVREYRSALVDDPSRRRLARARLRDVLAKGPVRAGDRTWSREDFYEAER